MTVEEIKAIVPDEYGRRKLPDGNRVTLGDWVTLGDGVKLGNRVTLGDWVTLGDEVTLGDGVKLGNRVTLGDWVKLGNRVTLGDWVTLGDEVTLGDGVTDAIYLGHCENYPKTLACVEGIAYFSAGCRWFTLPQAREYWKDREDRSITKILVETAAAIAKLKGWKEE